MEKKVIFVMIILWNPFMSYYRIKEEKMNITKIVITGGPCGGKSTAMDKIKERFSQKGYKVLIIHETATELISGGIAPWTCGTNLDYQKCQMKLQMEKEALIEKAARTMEEARVLIVCDRGTMDNKAYLSEQDFTSLLTYIGMTEEELYKEYAAVFHLVTAADGAEQFYTTANNSSRIETPKEAIAVDKRLRNAWEGHPHLTVIENTSDFETKISTLLSEMEFFLDNNRK